MTDPHNGLRILIAEDNPGDQYLITELLAASVIKIQLLTMAETLEKAIDHLQKESFDIILLDLSLPDSSGIDTFKKIKEHTGKAPVIILSALADMKIAAEAISLGAQDYHIKSELGEKMLTKTILYSIERKSKLENLRDDNERYITISKAELELMRSEDITRRIISSALDAIVCIDIYGKITVWNPQAEKIFGWRQDEILGKTLTETIIPAEYRDKHEKGMRHYLSTGEGPVLNKLIEISAVNRAGQHFPVELSIVPLTEGANRFFCAFIRDITEMKKAQTALKQSNERFEMIARTTNDAIWEWDFETSRMWGNETHQQFYGLTTADPVPPEKQWQERLHPDDRESIIKKQAEALVSDTNVFITEYRFNSEKEGYRNMYDRCYIVRDAEGKAIRILGSMMDITERKKADELIKESEERYKALVENAPEALVVFDADHGKFVSVSESAVKFFKMSAAELLKIGPVDVSPAYQPDGRLSAESAMEKIGEAIAGNKPSFEWTHCDKEGNLIPCEVWLVRLPSETQTLIRGSIIDISVRKNAELKLKESEKKYRSVIEQATDLIMITDQQGNFIDANSSFYKTFGYTKEELLAMNINQVIDPEQLKIRPVRFDLLIKGETVLNERRMMTRAGAFIDVEANVKMLPDGRILAIARDISDRKKAEQELEESYRAIRKLTEHVQNIREQERAHMAREIHDELGQQLTVLKMDIAWISKKIGIQDEPVNERMKELLVMLDETVKSVRRISSELRPSLLDDLGLIAAMEWQLTEFKKRFEIKTYFKPGDAEIILPESIKTGLFRIFQESLTNVARHSKAKKVTVSINMKNGSIVLSVVDNGVGFDKQNSIDKKTLGILGMQERTAMMGGVYEISGKPGKGTRIVVTIPLDDSNKN